MPNSDAFALRRSGFNDFLFACIGTEANGMSLSVLSVFARTGSDPWKEAERLARLPNSEATESLARSISNMPASLWPLQAARDIAVGLIALLPTEAARAHPKSPARALGTTRRRYISIAVVLFSIVCALAFEANLFPTLHTLELTDENVASFAAAPR